jgi:hypothetical protein
MAMSIPPLANTIPVNPPIVNKNKTYLNSYILMIYIYKLKTILFIFTTHRITSSFNF